MPYTKIGTHNAKARLSELLQNIKRGERFTITVRGVAVADLVPSSSSVPHNTQTAIEKMRNIHKVHGVSKKTLSGWITEGRR